MLPNVTQPDPDETPTAVLNDAPTLIRIRRLAQLARERIECAPNDDALALACVELAGIEALAAEALR